MNYFAIPGLITKKVFKAKDINGIISRIEEVCDLPKGVMKRKNSMGRPFKSYGGVSLSDIRMAMYMYFMDEAKLSSIQVAKYLGLNHGSVIVGRQAARKFKNQNDERFMAFYRFVKGIVLCEEVKPPSHRQEKIKKEPKPKKMKLTEGQQWDIYAMKNRGLSVVHIAVKYEISEWLVNKTLHRVREQMQLAS